MLETLVVLQASNAAYVDVPAILNCRAQACELGRTTGLLRVSPTRARHAGGRLDVGLSFPTIFHSLIGAREV